jgi:hypothetical protein
LTLRTKHFIERTTCGKRCLPLVAAHVKPWLAVELMISRQILLPFFLLAAVLPVPALAAAQGHLCWMARVSKAADGSAEVRFNANAADSALS